MDLELTAWQMLYLCMAPSVVYASPAGCLAGPASALNTDVTASSSLRSYRHTTYHKRARCRRVNLRAVLTPPRLVMDTRDEEPVGTRRPGVCCAHQPFGGPRRERLLCHVRVETEGEWRRSAHALRLTRRAALAPGTRTRWCTAC